MILQRRQEILWAGGARFELDDIFLLRKRLKQAGLKKAVIDLRDAFTFPDPFDLSVIFANPDRELAIACLVPPRDLPRKYSLFDLTGLGRNSPLCFFYDEARAGEWLAGRPPKATACANSG